MSALIKKALSTSIALPVRNPRLTGLCCLHCGAIYPLQLLHNGCPVCRLQGLHVSLRAHYAPGDTVHQLPYGEGIQLGEGNTPLLDMPGLSRDLGVLRLSIKDESRNPTGSHKDRMSAMGVNQALDFGAHTVVLASSGNAAVSAARYAQAAGLACEVATYEGMPSTYVQQLNQLGAQRFAFADNAARWAFVQMRAQQPGYLALTNHHLPALGSAPLAVEGYKAIAHECHASGCVPDHVMVPTARGDLVWGIYAGFHELLVAGHLQRLPRIWVVEPLARLSLVLGGMDAMSAVRSTADSLQALTGHFPGVTDQFSTAGSTVTYLQWQAVDRTAGGAVVVGDAKARAARRLLTREGVSAELCAAAGLAAAQQLRARQTIAADAHVLLMLTASATHDPSWPDPV